MIIYIALIVLALAVLVAGTIFKKWWLTAISVFFTAGALTYGGNVQGVPELINIGVAVMGVVGMILAIYGGLQSEG